MESCIYEGYVRHRRRAPVSNEFRYSTFMMYVDLAELQVLSRLSPLWSCRRPALAWFRRSDYLGDPAVPLDGAVRNLVAAHTGKHPSGPVRLLTHWRTFGYCFNPVSFYYCYDASGTMVETIVAEITNTPWDERHSYVLDEAANLGTARRKRYQFRKSFFVSPFMDMDQEYDWRFIVPGRQLVVHMENRRAGDRFFDATMVLERREITGSRLNGLLARYPLMTLRVIGAIYYQALRLKLKGSPTYERPDPPRPHSQEPPAHPRNRRSSTHEDLDRRDRIGHDPTNSRQPDPATGEARAPRQALGAQTR